MGAIVNSLNEFVNQIFSIGRLLKSLLDNNLGGLFTWLPSPLPSLFMNCMAIVVAFKILGREG